MHAARWMFESRPLRIIWCVLAAVSVVSALDAPTVSGAAAGYKVVVNAANPTTSLSRQQLTRYFLKKTQSWPVGEPVGVVDLDKSSTTRAAFSQDVLRKSVAEVTAYWHQQIFAGRAVPPPEKRNDAEVIAFVASHQGAIGYVSEHAAVGSGAKVLVVVP